MPPAKGSAFLTTPWRPTAPIWSDLGGGDLEKLKKRKKSFRSSTYQTLKEKKENKREWELWSSDRKVMKERINLEREKTMWKWEKEGRLHHWQWPTTAMLHGWQHPMRERVDLVRGDLLCMTITTEPNWPVRIEPSHKYWKTKIMHISISKS